MWVGIDLRLRDTFSQMDITEAGRNGNFKISKLYEKFLANNMIVPYEKVVWCKIAAPMHRFIVSQAIHSHPLTRDNLLKRQILIDFPSCLVCGCELECHSHLLFSCSFSWRVLHLIGKWLGDLMWPSKFEIWKNWLNMVKIRSLLAQVLCAALAGAMYDIWLNRNLRTYKQSCLAPICMDKIIRYRIRLRVIFVNERKYTKRDRVIWNCVNCVNGL